ncbi:MAG: acetylxylan esterase [Bacteroidales bacterium]|jgi:cephalosporin-C deacetylase-like acetyl esterase|nr:acetylxylan esterase [Bacteroidales bacterium]
MKTCKSFLLSAIALTGLMACYTEKKNVVDLSVDHQWKFALGDDMNRAAPDFDDSAWATISSATNWESQGFPDYDGFAWYRRQITIPDSFSSMIRENGGIVVRYTNADDADEFFFNGHSIGKTGDFPPSYESKYGEMRKYIVPAEYIAFDRPNTAAVRVYDGGGGGGLLTPFTTVRPLTPADRIEFSCDFPASEWTFLENAPQQANVSLKNTLAETVSTKIIFILKTDNYHPIDSISTAIRLTANENKTIAVPFKLPAPGFYRCELYIEKDGYTGDVKKCNIGYEPEKIASPSDAKPDFETFWKITRAGLDSIKPDYKLTLIPERSTGARNIYHVTMKSFGNVAIEGYYAAPKQKSAATPKKYPAIAVYMGYGSDAYFPHTDGNPGYAEFILSVRGQGIQKPGNTYGDWIVWGLDSKETYYYRGAFMDLVRAVDFLSSRPEVDASRIVAEGASQGGAFTLAACALDSRILAGAPAVPFLSDYRDYFEITHWPRSSFDDYLAKHPGRTWNEVYDVLSYFDVKNLAGWIKCPIIMGVGLQDDVCPPHTNFSSYNLITSEKHYRIYHDQAHSTPNTWYEFRTAFFNQKTQTP